MSNLSDFMPGTGGMRNRIINGGMVIDQRNAGASGTATAVFTVDRWTYGATQATKLTWGQNLNSITSATGFPKYLGVQSSSAYAVLAADIFAMQQPIEGFNTADLAWGTSSAKTITLSFKVYSSLTGTFGGSINNATPNRSYPFSYSIPTANTWTTISVVIPGDTSGTWATDNTVGIRVYFGLGVGSTFSGTAGAWAGADYRSATGSVSVVGTNLATWYVTGIQLEVGAVTTTFEQRPYGMELAMCQRYYEVGGSAQLFAGSTTSGSIYYNTVSYAVVKRSNPSAVVFTDVANSGFAAGTPILGNNGTNAFNTSKTANATVSGGYYQYSWTASAEL